MTKAEELYCGKVGEEYWKRSQARLFAEAPERAMALRRLLPSTEMGKRWVEVGCGRGHNLYSRDVGIDIDPRVFAAKDIDFTGIVASAYKIPLPDKSYDVVFSVGCLMHLPACSSSVSVMEHIGCATWQGAAQEMARISREYVIIGEYWRSYPPYEQWIEWHGEKGVLWARTYTVPGFRLIGSTNHLPPFDKNLTFGIFEVE